MFSWGGSKSPAPAPAATSSHSPVASRRASTISRNIHLSSYMNHSVLKPSTRRVSNDDTIYDTVFQTTNGFALILRVYLPNDTSRAPTMTLHGVRASHNWLDIRMKVIGYAPISSDQSWRSSNLKLGDAVYTVIHHFQLTPPSILEITDANLRRLNDGLRPPANNGNVQPEAAPPSYPTQNGSYHADQPRHQTQPQPQHEFVPPKPNFEIKDYEVDSMIPPIPSSFLKIDNMHLSELNQLVENNSVLQQFIDGTSEVKTLKEIKQSIETSNVNAAKANLVHESEMEDLCATVESLKQDLTSKMQRYRELDAERVALTHPPDLQEAIGELNVAKKSAYRESEQFADEWIDAGGEDVNDFVKKFMVVRLLYHSRAAKAERLENSM